MAYDEDLADRVRELLGGRVAFEERKMFGGLAFMVNTHMACGCMGVELMVRVGQESHDAALARGAREMDFTGRPMRSMVIVPAHLLADRGVLEEWVDQAARFARSQPAKTAKRRSRP